MTTRVCARNGVWKIARTSFHCIGGFRNSVSPAGVGPSSIATP